MITVGIDEVGRGCWAGPLVAGAVILDAPMVGLRDSKKLSKSQRERLAAEIQIQASAIGLGWITPVELDSLGMTESIRLAMRRALESITSAYEEIIIDGNINYFPTDARTKAVIKADDTVPAVSAASIIAKVARDKFMYDAALEFPHYLFEKNVGYGTAAHIAALEKFGVSELHRKSFKPIKAFIGVST